MRSKLTVFGLLFAAAVAGGVAVAGAVAGAGPGPSGAKLVAGPAGAALEHAQLTTAFTIGNDGGADAGGVSVTLDRCRRRHARCAARLPVVLGTIPAKRGRTVYARFAGRAFAAGGAYVLKIAGRFAGTDFAVERRVRVPAASPGSARAFSSSSRPHVVRGARYPHVQPNFAAAVNDSHAPPVPLGEFRAPMTPPPATAVQPAKADPPPITFFSNVPIKVGAYALAEPSGDVANGVVFASMNTIAAFSADGGAHFTPVDPTTLFPNSDGGLCCDQIVKYVASIDPFVWLLHTRPERTRKAKRRTCTGSQPPARRRS